MCGFEKQRSPLAGRCLGPGGEGSSGSLNGGHGIIGGHIPLAAGVAFASKYQDTQDVTLCFFGDGAVSIGGFHEGVSLAALWKLPVPVSKDCKYSRLGGMTNS